MRRRYLHDEEVEQRVSRDAERPLHALQHCVDGRRTLRVVEDVHGLVNAWRKRGSASV